MTTDLHAYAKTFPSQGGVEIGPWLEKYASEVPLGSAIVEVGCWLGAGTAHLALGAMESGAAIHCFDRWTATVEEVRKAKEFGVSLIEGEDYLPRVERMLQSFDCEIHYRQGNLKDKDLSWSGPPIGLYVDDATKVEELWLHAMKVFKPHFIPGKTILVLMDYWFFETHGSRYAAQQRYMAEHADQFEMVEERLGETTAAVFRFKDGE